MTAIRTPKAAPQATAGVIYRGPSLLDGAPIVVVATYRVSKTNRKTGVMLQTWILREDVSPIAAVHSGADASICGTCAHRGTRGFSDRDCYVNVSQAPNSVWRAVARGSYADVDAAAIGAGRMVRLGSYGDPAAVPLTVWQSLVSRASGHTGYTHAWRALPEAALGLQALCMASADTEADRVDAVAAGWRTFRVRTAAEPLMLAEFTCPASAEAGARTTCAACLSCAGSDGRRGSPTIIAHGAFARRFAANQARGASAVAA